MKRDILRRAALMSLCIVIAIGLILLFFLTGDSGLKTSTAKDEILQNHVAQTGADNAVAAIYLNYRLWDTLFEALVLLISAVAVIIFSRSGEDEG